MVILLVKFLKFYFPSQKPLLNYTDFALDTPANQLLSQLVIKFNE